ncbi:hypothetical protein MPSEU_000602000 [Mayamaea pseudoterrestris]|nr:hypothetical protein MPSEU_000602000 [Mayamaea pseudoterrestris]
MKALEMEFDADEHEQESFLDPDDRALRETKKPVKPSFFATPNGKLASSFMLIVVIVLIFSGVAPDGDYDDEGNDAGQASSASSTTSSSSSSSSSTDSSNGNSLINRKMNHSTELLYSNYATIVPDPYVSQPSDEKLQTLQEKWSKWKFWDGDEEMRPKGDYCAAFTNRDIPGDAFPDNAWQADAVFVNHYLDAAEQLISRAKEAIFTEYGHGKPLPPEGLAERLKMFHWDKPDGSLTEHGYPFDKTKGTGDPTQGGWTTKRSFQGLVRRLLHAMMTNDKFTVVLAGHSAAAGHGNHFHQSYIHQMHKIMAPIFARLGVQLVTRNQAIGGLGTLPMALAFADMYGDDIDLILWDSGMTEGKEAFDLFLRQALLSGKKVPVVWAGHGEYFEALSHLHDAADVDVGEWGTAMAGILKTNSNKQAKTLPKAVRYMSCESGVEDLCKNAERFCASCWLRTDLDPQKLGFPPIRPNIGGQVRWHPGWQAHQLTGRLLAFALLEALQDAVQQWSEGTMGGPPLDDDYWHITAYYDNIRNKVNALDSGLCFDGQWPSRACLKPMHGRGEHTPRVNPSQSGLTSIIRPTASGYKPYISAKPLYDGPDGHNPCYDVADDDIDTLTIVSGRRQLIDADASLLLSYPLRDSSSRYLAGVVPGKGWELVYEKPGLCDGDYYSICGRASNDDCPALAHHDSRGTIVGNELSGWIVMDIPEVKNGLIMLRFLSYLTSEDSPMTKDWTSVNNERRSLRLGSNETLRRLSMQSDLHYDMENPMDTNAARRLTAKEFPDSFKLEYSVNGAVTTLSKDEFLLRIIEPQRVFEMITLLDDASFSSTNVEVAIRLRDCGHDCMIGLTHLYWT